MYVFHTKDTFYSSKKSLYEKTNSKYSREARIDENNLFLYEKIQTNNCVAHIIYIMIFMNRLDKFYSFISKYGEVLKKDNILSYLW